VPNPGRPGRERVSVNPVNEMLVIYNRRSFRTTFVMALFLVLLAGANVAAFGVARVRQRIGELVVRRALGASSWRLTARWPHRDVRD